MRREGAYQLLQLVIKHGGADALEETGQLEMSDAAVLVDIEVVVDAFPEAPVHV